MTTSLAPGGRHGTVRVPASKSQAHRLLILAALGGEETTLLCDGISRDIAATADCLRALGADIRETEGRLRVRPIRKAPGGLCRLPCGESGSTLRFLLPVVGALGAECVFLREGRLPKRPLAPLEQQLTAHGMTLRAEGAALHVSGRLTPGAFTLPGDVSSQYLSGLLLALPLLEGDSTLAVTGTPESAGYIAMTEQALALADISPEKQENLWRIGGGQRPRLPRRLAVEGDYSSAAFFLCMGALSRRGIAVKGLDPLSVQGDRAILHLLRRFGAEVREEGDRVLVRRGARLHGIVIDAAPVPDLIPALAALAAAAEGETRVVNAARLRLKESDRLQSTAALLRSLGGSVQELHDGLIVGGGTPLTGGTVKPFGDHRIAMAAAVAACAAAGDVTVRDSDCVKKSYPRFWADFAALTRE